MKTCETCKHWKRKLDHGYDSWDTLRSPYIFRTCDRAIPLWDASEYSDEGSVYRRVLTDENKDRKFFAQDGSDYHAVVITRNDFGCVEHEPLDIPSDPMT